MTLHFLNDATDDAESTQKSIIASSKSETLGKLINRIPGSRLLISSLPGLASRMHVELLRLYHFVPSLQIFKCIIVLYLFIQLFQLLLGSV